MKKFHTQMWILILILAADVILAVHLAGTAALAFFPEGSGRELFAGGSHVPVSGKAEHSSEDSSKKTEFLALTFDDGPHPVWTKKLLDGLRERGVKASFFLLGENIEGNEELIRQMEEDGHLIGVHCYEHVNLTKTGLEEAVSQIQKTSKMIESVTGKAPAYIRPPYGKWNEELEESLQMTPVFWDIDTLDWKSQNSGSVLRVIQSNAGKHQIVLMHDIFSSTVEAALAAIDTLREQGYTFVTVDELLID